MRREDSAGAQSMKEITRKFNKKRVELNKKGKLRMLQER